MAESTTQIGSVITLNGSVWAVSGTSQRPLTEGAPVYEGEEIVTETGSNVEIKFVDDTILGQGENSAVRLDDYVFDGEDGSLDFHMIQGVMRVVSGEIVKSNPEGFNLSTPLATIGIRGTEVMIQVDQGREFIGVDKLGEGHTVLISNAFNQVVIDKAGMFSGVDFDGSLIAPDEMPESFITSIVRAAPLTLLGDPPRTVDDPQDVVPPQFYETIDNQTGEYQPGVGMEVAEEDDEEEDDFEEEFELTEAEIEAMLEMETAAGTEAGGEGEEFGPVTDVAYDPYGNEQGSGEGSGAVGTGEGVDEAPTGGDDSTIDEPVVDTPPPTVEDATAHEATEEDAPVSFNVLSGTDGEATLVDASLSEESHHEGEVTFEPEGTITYTPEPGEDGNVVIDYTIATEDGETSTAQLTFTLVEDSEPEISTTDATGVEVNGFVTASGTITTDFGSDAEGSSVTLSADNADWYAQSGVLMAQDGSWSIELTDTGYEYTQLSTLASTQYTAPGETVDVNVTVTAVDGDGSVGTGTFSITVTDEGPTATDATVTQTVENEAVSYNVLAEAADTGLYGGTLVAASLTDGSTAEGEVGFTADGDITYTPAAGEEGTFTIDYTVRDTDGDTASAQLTVTLAEDSEPTFTTLPGTTQITEEGGLASTTVAIDADFGADDADTSIELASDMAQPWDSVNNVLTAEDGSWEIRLDENGDYKFTQFVAFDHTDGDQYVIDVDVIAKDADGSTSIGEFTVLVADDGPTASPVTMSHEIFEDSEDYVTYNVFDGAVTVGTDGGGTLVDAWPSDHALANKVDFAPDGTIEYYPEYGEEGTVTINYTVEDADGSTASNTLTIELSSDTKPVITGLADVGGVESAEDLVEVSGSFAIDYAPDGSDGFDIYSDQPSDWYEGTLYGDGWELTLTTDEDGNVNGYNFFQTDPIDHEEGEDYVVNFTLTAYDTDGSETMGTFSVSIGDDGPTATPVELVHEIGGEYVEEVAYNVFESGAATYSVDGETELVDVWTDSEHADKVEFDADGTIYYTPDYGEEGTVTINYMVEDSDGSTATSALSITINGDSEPVITGLEGGSGIESEDGLVEVSDNFGIYFGSDGDGGIEITSDQPAEHYGDYLVGDGWVLALTGGEEGGNYGYVFTQTDPIDHIEGEDYVVNFTLTAYDGDGSETTATFSVTVGDDGPTATPVELVHEIFEGTPEEVVYNVFDSGAAIGSVDEETELVDAWPDNHELADKVDFYTDGTIFYTPEYGEEGTVTINYTVEDADGTTSTSAITITLSSDTHPTITTSDVTGDETGGLVTLEGDFGIDFHEDSEGATYTLKATNAVWDGLGGTLTDKDGKWVITVKENGGYTFVQNTAFTHTDATDPNDAFAIDVAVTAMDGDGSMTEGLFTVTVNDDGPTASFASVTQDTVDATVNYNVFGEGAATTGIDGGSLVSATLGTDGTYTGTLSSDSLGNVTYDPSEGETGSVTIDYTVADSDGDTATSQLTIDLLDPTPTDVTVTTGENGEEIYTGTEGDDTIDGGQGKDGIYGTAGSDLLIGDKSHDTIFGGDGNDIIGGGQGGDELYGEGGHDFLVGGKGNDYLVGGEDEDILSGGSGNDTFVFTSPDDGEDLILDFKTANDQIALFEATFDQLAMDDEGHVADHQFAVIEEAEYSGGYEFTGATGGLLYTSAKDSDIGKLYYDPNDQVTGDETLIATINETDGDLDADDIDIV